MHIWWIRVLESSKWSRIMMMHHLVNGVIILWIFLILLCLLIASLALILGILLCVRMSPMTWYTHKICTIIIICVILISKLLTWIILISLVNWLITHRFVVILFVIIRHRLLRRWVLIINSFFTYHSWIFIPIDNLIYSTFP